MDVPATLSSDFWSNAPYYAPTVLFTPPKSEQPQQPVKLTLLTCVGFSARVALKLRPWKDEDSALPTDMSYMPKTRSRRGKFTWLFARETATRGDVYPPSCRSLTDPDTVADQLDRLSRCKTTISGLARSPVWSERPKADAPKSRQPISGSDVYSSIVEDLMIPRLERVSNQIYKQGNHTIDACDIVKNEGRLAHVELLLHLIQNRDSFDSSFWGKVNCWQIEEYQQACKMFLQSYKQATNTMESDEDIKLVTEALERVSERAYSLTVSEKPTWEDVLVVRSIYNDPDLKTLIQSDRFAPERRLAMAKAAEEMSLQQPLFPPYCYALLST